jgi:hypothetical protein
MPSPLAESMETCIKNAFDTELIIGIGEQPYFENPIRYEKRSFYERRQL